MLQLRSEMARRKGAWEAFSCVVGEHTDAGGKKREKERKCCDVSMRDQTAESEWQLSKVWGLSLEQIDLACQSERSFSSIRQRRDKKEKKEDDEASTSFLFLRPVANAAGLPEGVVARRHKWPGFSSPGHFPGDTLLYFPSSSSLFHPLSYSSSFVFFLQSFTAAVQKFSADTQLCL